MRKISIYLFAIFAVSFLVILPVYSSSTNQIISASGAIQYRAFQIHGASVAINIFEPSARNYQPNAWQILEDLGINVIRVWGGIEGDVAHLNIRNYPNDWAQNLDAFLTEADSHGIKVFFHSLGSSWGTLFGIVSPGDTAGPVPATPIDEAKAMIDQLAGDNSLGHNFIKDPRVVGWRTSNELNINDSEIYDWNIELCDYIRSKGGTVWISSPTAGGGSDNYDFHLTEPMLRGHVDYLEAHYYEVRDYVLYCNKDYTTFYNWYKNVLQNKMVSGRGSFDLDHVILGEFGIWSGYGSDLGIEATFTDEERRDYYQAVLDAARDAGIKNVMLHDFFAQKYADGTYETPNYGVVDVDGSHYPYVADVINEVYTS